MRKWRGTGRLAAYQVTMGWFDWLGGRRERVEPPPRWARALDDGQRFDAFADLVVVALEERGLRVDLAAVRSGSVMVEHRGQPLELFLHDLVARCADAHPDSWPEVVAEALDGKAMSSPRRKKRRGRKRRPKPNDTAVDEIAVGGTRIDLARGPFEAVAPLLKVQLFSRWGRTAYVDMLDREAVVMRELCDGLLAALVFDLGSHERTVAAEHLSRWGVSRDEAFERGLDNLFADPVQLQQLDELDAFLAVGNGSFVASLALRLDQLCALAKVERGDDDDGWLVGVPNWHALVFVPLRDTMPSEAKLAALVRQLYGYDDAVSPDLFRVDADGWRKLRP